jgi:hypothetical protein
MRAAPTITITPNSTVNFASVSVPVAYPGSFVQTAQATDVTSDAIVYSYDFTASAEL